MFAVPLLSERGLPGLPSLREPEEAWELQREPSSSPELEDSSELDDSSENGLLLSRVAFCEAHVGRGRHSVGINLDQRWTD